MSEQSDETLVLCSLGGDRDAFAAIVSRYQNLLCSLAYASIGDIKHSEDIAQDAFVDAWKQLDSLREPAKLKAWLSGIVRFKASHFLRKASHQPAEKAEQITDENQINLQSEALENQIIDGQQQALMWQAMERMDSQYKEPLVLFYRENQSVEQVAEQLDLNVATAKQRLSRGRKLLHKSMVTYVEDALKRSRPGVAFTAGVLASINVISPPAKAAAFSSGAVKSASFFQWATLLAFIASISGLISTWFGLQASLDQSRTQRERRNTFYTVAGFIGTAMLFVLIMLALIVGAKSMPEWHVVLAIIAQCSVVAFIVAYIYLTITMLRRIRRLRQEERVNHPDAFDENDSVANTKKREYKSKWSLLGVPLIHVRLSTPELGDKPVFGWLAGGDVAYGLLFAWGGFALAPVSVGVISGGIFTVGAVGIGIIGLGTVGMGVIGFGASAIAYKAYASLSSLGWHSAFSNGFSVAKEAAIGPVAFAQHVNNDEASSLMSLTLFGETYLWLLGAIAVLVIIPAALYAYFVRRRMGKSLK